VSDLMREPMRVAAPPLAVFVDERSGLRIEAHVPTDQPDLWRAYLDGAEARYREHGVVHALGREHLEDGRAASLVYLARDGRGNVVGGLRCHGPLRSATQAAALRELAMHPELDAIAELIESRVPLGVVEIKGVWVDPAYNGSGLSDALARCYVHAMEWFGAQYAICTCSAKVADRWGSSGGRSVEGWEPVPFPDVRYRTVLLWWEHDRIEELADPEQWKQLVTERSAIRSSSLPAWRAELLVEGSPDDGDRLAALLADPRIDVVDELDDQLDSLRRVRPAIPDELINEPARWAHFPWRRTMVRILGPESFRALRLDRNRNKITREEQNSLARLRVGVVGLSVGHAIAHTLALEGIVGELRLADFDHIELSNLNRIPATVLDLGINKAVVAARRIAELDPYLRVEICPDGLTADNTAEFVEGLDVVVEECDSLDVKATVRDAARRAGIPVLMETSDRGLIDVERFDLEPDRPIFHGLLGAVQPGELVGLSTHDKVPHVLRILEPAELSSRMAASMAEIDETLTTWPQLAGDVTLGAATIAAAVRRLGRGGDLPSGRARVDLDDTFARLAEPARVVEEPERDAVVPEPPADPALAVAHAANRAPSGGNVQPWQLSLTEERLRISLDRTRTSKMDVKHRGSYVAIGAALVNARIAAAAHGILGETTLFPDGDDVDVVGEVAFGATHDVVLASRYRVMLDRSTNRHAGLPAPLPDGLPEQLAAQVEAEGGELHLLTGKDAIADYAEILAESDRFRYLSPRLHAELMSELRWPAKDELHTGIDVRTLELDGSDLAKLAVAKRADVMADLAAWDGGRALGDITRARVRASSGLAIVTVPDARPASFVRGGSAVQQLWLAANAAGLAVQPVSPVSVFAVDDEDFAGLVPDPYVVRLQMLTARLRGLFDLPEGRPIGLVVRLAYAPPPSTPSMRIPLEDALLGGSREIS
jgi:hypothetical protein